MQWEYAQMRVGIMSLPHKIAAPGFIEIWTFPAGEFHIEKVDIPRLGGGEENLLLEQLNKLGDEGWELVWVDTFSHGVRGVILYHLFFKRPKPEK